MFFVIADRIVDIIGLLTIVYMTGKSSIWMYRKWHGVKGR